MTIRFRFYKETTVQKRKNLLFIMTDHQRFDSIYEVQCGREVTPNLNKLADSGAFFTRAYNVCPLCVPARTSLATGIYPTQNGIVYNDWKGLHAGSYPTIYELLKQADYQVGHVGVDHIKTTKPLSDLGLDHYKSQVDYNAWAKAQGIPTERDSENLTTVLEDVLGQKEERRYSNTRVSEWTYPTETYKDSYFLEESLNFLKKADKSKAFALFTCFWAPHPPLVVPKEYLDMYPLEEIRLPDNVGKIGEKEPSLRREGVPAQLAEGLGHDDWKKVWQAHLALTTMVDRCIGTLINYVRDQGLLEDTLIVFTPDHGDHLGQHRRYQKMEMFEEAVKVPLIIGQKDAEPQVLKQVVSHMDVFPTLVDLLDLDFDCSAYDGKSLRPLIYEGLDPNRPAEAYCQYSGNPNYGTIRRAVITDRYKYVYDGRDHELYDLVEDPAEMHNIAGSDEHRALVAELYERCRAYHEKRGDRAFQNTLN